MARKTIQIVKDHYSHLYIHINDNRADKYPLNFEIRRYRRKPMDISVSVEEYDTIIAALIKQRIINFPEKEFECMLSK